MKLGRRKQPEQAKPQPPEAAAAPKPSDNGKLEVITGNTSVITIKLLAQINQNLVALSALLKNRWIEEDKRRG